MFYVDLSTLTTLPAVLESGDQIICKLCHPSCQEIPVVIYGSSSRHDTGRHIVCYANGLERTALIATTNNNGYIVPDSRELPLPQHPYDVLVVSPRSPYTLKSANMGLTREYGLSTPRRNAKVARIA